MSGYVELQVISNFSFLRGASHIEELAVTALAMGYESMAITDRNTLAGSLTTGGSNRSMPTPGTI